MIKAIQKQTHLARWGNSKAVRIPEKIIKQLRLSDDQEIMITTKNDAIILTPVKKEPTNIHELFKDWQDDGQRDHELDWGKSEGHELPW